MIESNRFESLQLHKFKPNLLFFNWLGFFISWYAYPFLYQVLFSSAVVEIYKQLFTSKF